jgi:hypothetical protein
VARRLVMPPHREGGQAQYVETPVSPRPGRTMAQVLDFFAAPAKDERVTAFEAHHLLTGLHGSDHQLVDEGLRRALAAAALAHMHDAGSGGGVFQHGDVDQVVHQNDRGAGNGLDGFERQQFGVTGACADQGATACGGRVHGLTSCKMCWTCCAIACGTGMSPRKTRWI